MTHVRKWFFLALLVVATVGSSTARGEEAEPAEGSTVQVSVKVVGTPEEPELPG